MRYRYWVSVSDLPHTEQLILAEGTQLILSLSVVDQVMCSYNAVNGVPTCLDGKAQNGLLRGEWKFDGMIVSDCDAIGDAWAKGSGHGYAQNASDATAKGLLAGTDMDCGTTYNTGGADAVSSGALPIPALDLAVRRSFTMRFRLGEFDAPHKVPYRSTELYGRSSLDTQQSRDVALHAAEESIVLLQNRNCSKTNAPLLPLARSSTGSVLRVGVFGPMADPVYPPDDKGDYCPSFKVSPTVGLEAAARQLGHIEVVTCVECCEKQISHEIPPNCDLTKASNFAKSVDVVVLVLGGNLGGEGKDWAAQLPEQQAALAKAVVDSNQASVAVLQHGNPMSIDSLASSYDAIVEGFEGGQSGGTALARMLLGESDISPSGVLPWTVYPDDYTATLKMSNMAMRAGLGRTYRFFKGKPTFAFGHGLTYTQFAFEWEGQQPGLHQTVASIQTGLSFQVKVTNVGHRAGAKVVAAYVHVEAEGVPDGPIKQLFSQEKVLLEPGSSTTVTLESRAVPGFCSFCSVDEAGESTVRPGTLTITIGDGGHDGALLIHKMLVA